MALTIETQPQQYQPVWHDQIIEASSTLISEDERSEEHMCLN